MSLSGVCPECGCRADLAVFASAGETNRALAAALELPAPLAGRVLRYLRLFSPPQKALAMNKATRLLTELSQSIASGEVTRKGVAWAAPLSVWEAALDAVLATPPERLPLTGHGYLFEVIANLAAKEQTKTERQQEEQVRHRPLIGPGPRDPGPVSTTIQELVSDLRALQKLESGNPGRHAADIARLQQRLAELRVQAGDSAHV